MKTKLGVSSAKFALVFFMASSLQAAYAGSLEDGIKLYNAKDYKGAKPHFETAARNSPMSWQAHFYLASTMMATGDLQGARNEFSTASKITTNPEIGRRCREGLDRVNKMLAGASNAGTARGGASSVVTSSSSSTGSAYSPAAEEAAKFSAGNSKRRDEIMAKARAECAAIRTQAAEQIKQEQENSNQQFRHADGSVKYDISDDREAEIRRDAEERCKRIMEIAEQTCKSYK
jgi:Spy/CpxP family protein refolding chaperone